MRIQSFIPEFIRTSASYDFLKKIGRLAEPTLIKLANIVAKVAEATLPLYLSSQVSNSLVLVLGTTVLARHTCTLFNDRSLIRRIQGTLDGLLCLTIILDTTRKMMRNDSDKPALYPGVETIKVIFLISAAGFSSINALVVGSRRLYTVAISNAPLNKKVTQSILPTLLCLSGTYAGFTVARAILYSPLAQDKQRYIEAIPRAQVETPKPIPMLPSDGDIEVVSFTTYNPACPPATCCQVALPSARWVTLEGSLKEICSSMCLPRWKPIHFRAAEILGLAPSKSLLDRQVIRLLVNTKDLFPACLGAQRMGPYILCERTPNALSDRSVVTYLQSHIAASWNQTLETATPYSGDGRTFNTQEWVSGLPEYISLQGTKVFVLGRETLEKYCCS